MRIELSHKAKELGIIRVELFERDGEPGAWSVEAYDNDGSIFQTIFYGNESGDRAAEYAKFKYGG